MSPDAKPTWIRSNALVLSVLMLCGFMYCVLGLVVSTAPSLDDSSATMLALQQQTMLFWLGGALLSLFASVYFAFKLAGR